MFLLIGKLEIICNEKKDKIKKDKIRQNKTK